jgi:hypothetical protein
MLLAQRAEGDVRGFEFIPNGVDDVPLALMIAIGPFIDEVTVLRVEMNQALDTGSLGRCVQRRVGHHRRRERP